MHKTAISPLVMLWRYYNIQSCKMPLTHWGRVTHTCVSKLIIIGSDNGLSPDRRQAIIWINAGILLIGPWGANFSEILIRIQTFSFKKLHLKTSSAKWRLFCLGLNELKWVDRQSCDISIADAVEIPQFCTEPSKYNKKSCLTLPQPDMLNCWLSCKLWCLQHNCVGDTIVYH